MQDTTALLIGGVIAALLAVIFLAFIWVRIRFPRPAQVIYKTKTDQRLTLSQVDPLLKYT